MKTFKDFVSGIQEEITVPDETEKKFQETLNNIGNSNSYNITQNRHKRSGLWYMGVAGAAAAFVFSSVLYFSANPVKASKIPLIGHIFEQVEDKSFYPGEYNKTQLLDKKIDEQDVFKSNDKEISITASEVYSDGFSVFVGLKIDSQKFDFKNMFKRADTEGNGICLATSYGINSPVSVLDYDISLTGENKGEHTFIGMAKFDKGSYSVENGRLKIKVSAIYLDDDTIEGNWELNIPYKTDKEGGKEIILNQHTNTGLTVQKVFISKYQLVLQSKVPYTMPYADKTDAEIIEECGNKKSTLDKEEIERIRQIKQYDFFEFAVFDKDGKPLLSEGRTEVDGNNELQSTMFSLNGKDVSKIHVYVTQKDENIFKLVNSKTQKKAAQKSEFDFVAKTK